MASYTKIIGDIGVSVVVSEFLKHGISVLLPYDDNSPYDIVIYVNNEFYKIQVKTTERVKYNGSQMDFEITKSNPYSKIDPKYVEGEVDYFALYCIENEWCGFFEFDEYKPHLTFRLKEPKNNQVKNIKFAKDYLFHDQIIRFFNKDYIKNNIVHTESDQTKVYKSKRKMKLCPVCEEKEIRINSSMCRECYDKSRKNTFYNSENVIKVKNEYKNLCPICETNYKYIRAEMCSECRKKERKKNIPPKEDLEALIYKMKLIEIGRMYNVTDSAVRGWCKKYNLPYRKKDIVSQ